MPDGKTHYQIYKRGFIVLPFLIGYLLIFRYWIVAAATLPGYLLGKWHDPDLDLVGVSNAEGRMMKDFGFFGALWAGWWMPYAYLMRSLGGHRSFWTHFPFVSTAIRLFWMFLPLGWVPYLVWKFYDIPGLLIVGQVFLGLWVGLGYADTQHWAADLATGEIGSIRRKGIWATKRNYKQSRRKHNSRVKPWRAGR